MILVNKWSARSVKVALSSCPILVVFSLILHLFLGFSKLLFYFWNGQQDFHLNLDVLHVLKAHQGWHCTLLFFGGCTLSWLFVVSLFIVTLGLLFFLIILIIGSLLATSISMIIGAIISIISAYIWILSSQELSDDRAHGSESLSTCFIVLLAVFNISQHLLFKVSFKLSIVSSRTLTGSMHFKHIHVMINHWYEEEDVSQSSDETTHLRSHLRDCFRLGPNSLSHCINSKDKVETSGVSTIGEYLWLVDRKVLSSCISLHDDLPEARLFVLNPRAYLE